MLKEQLDSSELLGEERNELKKKLLSKKKPERKDLENSLNLSMLQKMRLYVWKRTPRVWQ